MSLTAIIAGQGALPGLIVAELQARGLSFVLAELEGNSSAVDGVEPVRFRVERLVPFLDHLVGLGVTQVVMAGAVRRPERLEPDLFDPRTATLVPRLLAATGQGDDGALRIIIEIFEESGLAVVGVHDLLPDLLPGSGVLTRAQPGQRHREAAQLGETTVAEMGRSDSGQACIVAGDEVALREGPDGTDAMIARLLHSPVVGVPSPALGRAFAAAFGMPDHVAARMIVAAYERLAAEPRVRARDAILFKAPKPGQDRRADLPVVGPGTAVLAAEAGLAGIVIEAGGVMVIDLPRVLMLLDAMGLFLWVRPRGAAR
jgi:DUF1009 family protein